MVPAGAPALALIGTLDPLSFLLLDFAANAVIVFFFIWRSCLLLLFFLLLDLLLRLLCDHLILVHDALKTKGVKKGPLSQ
jgi:hypothetical protein